MLLLRDMGVLDLMGDICSLRRKRESGKAGSLGDFR